MSSCVCGNAISGGRGRRATYCSNACRQRAHRRRTTRPASEPDTGLTHLPTDTFVGRTAELDAVAAALRTARLVTVIGPGGVGKTRFALELLGSKPGVRLIDLTSTSDDRDLTEVFADALGIHDRKDEDLLVTLIATIESRRMRLLVDQCEHLAEPVARLVTALLQRCPNLRVLATSREVLRVAGETVFRLGPLAKPDCERLFADRASAVDPGFVPASGLCHRLDGMPLAIELAARHLRTADPAAVADAVHHDLASTIEWSYRLLSPREQKVLRKLSVCAGGFVIDTAKRVCADDEVLPVVLGLNTKSLLHRVHGSQTRYRMLDSIRQFAQKELTPAEHQEAYEGLVEWLVHLATPLRTTVRQTVATDLNDESANLAVVLRYLRDGRWALLAYALARAWELRGRTEAAARLLVEVLDRTADSEHRALALVPYGFIVGAQGQHTRALALGVEAVGLARHAGNTALTLRALAQVSAVLLWSGRVTTSIMVQHQVIEHAHRIGDPITIGLRLANLGWILAADHEWVRARRQLDHALELLREHTNLVDCNSALHTSATINLKLGNLTRARAELEIMIRSEPFDVFNWPYAVEGMAIVALREGDAVRCVTPLAAAEQIRIRCHKAAEPMWQDWVREAWRLAQQLLTPRRVEAAARRGAPLSDDEVRKLALAKDTPLTARQQDIVALLADGLSNQAIATRLGIATSTVNTGLDRIKQKLGLYRRAELITWHVERS